MRSTLFSPVPILENLVITWPYTDRPTERASDRPPAPQGNQCLLSHFLASLGDQEETHCTSMLWSIDSCQNRVSADQYHLTVPRAQVSSHRGRVFLKLSADKLPVSNDRRLQWFIRHMLCLSHYGPALLRFWFETDLGRQNSARFFKNAGGEDLFLPWSRGGHAQRPIFTLWLVKIWQVSSCRKFMQHLESCLLWQLKLTEFCVNLWCF